MLFRSLHPFCAHLHNPFTRSLLRTCLPLLFRAGSRAAQGPVSRATPRAARIRTRPSPCAPCFIRASLLFYPPARAHASVVRMLQNSTWVFYYFFGRGQKSGLCIGRGQKSALCIGFRWKSGPSPPLRDAHVRMPSQKPSSQACLRFKAPQGDFRTYTQSRFLASTYTQSRFLARSGAKGKSVRLWATRNLSATDPSSGSRGLDRRGAGTRL